MSLTSWNIPGLSEAEPEYYYYSNLYNQPPGGSDTPVLTTDQVSNITSSTYQYMGLNNTYNAKALYYNYGITDRRSVGDAIPSYLSSILTQFNFASLDELYAFIDTMA